MKSNCCLALTLALGVVGVAMTAVTGWGMFQTSHTNAVAEGIDGLLGPFVSCAERRDNQKLGVVSSLDGVQYISPFNEAASPRVDWEYSQCSAQQMPYYLIVIAACSFSMLALATLGWSTVKPDNGSLFLGGALAPIALALCFAMMTFVAAAVAPVAAKFERCSGLSDAEYEFLVTSTDGSWSGAVCLNGRRAPFFPLAATGPFLCELPDFVPTADCRKTEACSMGPCQELPEGKAFSSYVTAFLVGSVLLVASLFIQTGQAAIAFATQKSAAIAPMPLHVQEEAPPAAKKKTPVMMEPFEIEDPRTGPGAIVPVTEHVLDVEPTAGAAADSSAEDSSSEESEEESDEKSRSSDSDESESESGGSSSSEGSGDSEDGSEDSEVSTTA